MSHDKENTGIEISTKCLTCKKKGNHKSVHSVGSLHHLRCSTCSAVAAYLLEVIENSLQDVEYQDFTALMNRYKSRNWTSYAPSKSFSTGQYLKHAKFGRGYVIDLYLPSTKMEVLFEDRKRTLVCSPGPAGKENSTISNGEKKGKRVEKTTPPKRSAVHDDSGVKAKTSASDAKSNNQNKCPKCGHVVHNYNIAKSPNGKVVGCMYCR